MYTQLSQFVNIHAGKKAFVCGSGTSLKLCPANLAEHGIVICVNAAGLQFNKYQYLFITDPAVMQMAYWDEVLAKAENVIFAASLFEPEFAKMIAELPADKNYYLMSRNYGDHFYYKLSDHSILCLGYDAPVPATHFAYTLGCRPIVLCGIDLCFDATGTRYFHKDADLHKATSPYKEDFAKGLTDFKERRHYGETDKWLESSLPFWYKMYDQNPGLDQVIYNASPISAITHFKKVDINDMLA